MKDNGNVRSTTFMLCLLWGPASCTPLPSSRQYQVPGTHSPHFNELSSYVPKYRYIFVVMLRVNAGIPRNGLHVTCRPVGIRRNKTSSLHRDTESRPWESFPNQVLLSGNKKTHALATLRLTPVRILVHPSMHPAWLLVPRCYYSYCSMYLCIRACLSLALAAGDALSAYPDGVKGVRRSGQMLAHAETHAWPSACASLLASLFSRVRVHNSKYCQCTYHVCLVVISPGSCVLHAYPDARRVATAAAGRTLWHF